MIELKKYFPNLSQVQLKKFKRLFPIYNDWNSKVNLISRRDIENLFINHILHSLSIVNIIKFKDTSSILDVGTGGGFPGIPLAIFFPNVKFTLLDSIGKKIKVVESVSKDLSLSNVTAINERVENHFEKYDFILSRVVVKSALAIADAVVTILMYSDCSFGLSIRLRSIVSKTLLFGQTRPYPHPSS